MNIRFKYKGHEIKGYIKYHFKREGYKKGLEVDLKSIKELDGCKYLVSMAKIDRGYHEVAVFGEDLYEGWDFGYEIYMERFRSVLYAIRIYLNLTVRSKVNHKGR